MRIISGKYKHKNIVAPKNLPVRPTTDQAKEALFNILQHKVDFSDCAALDLFAGTGNITYELASRDTKSILSIDIHAGCTSFIDKTCKELSFHQVQTIQGDVFEVLSKPLIHQFDLIFADPPYNHPRLIEIPELIFRNNLLHNYGLFILEHHSLTQIKTHPNFIETRKYGSSSFSIYQLNP